MSKLLTTPTSNFKNNFLTTLDNIKLNRPKKNIVPLVPNMINCLSKNHYKQPILRRFVMTFSSNNLDFFIHASMMIDIPSCWRHKVQIL